MKPNKIYIHAPGQIQEHEFDTEQAHAAEDMPNPITNICSIGSGGGGGNILTDIVTRGMQHIEFAATNTDHPTLRNVHPSIKKFFIGDGKGAGAKPEVARRAAEKCEQDFIDFLTGRDLFFVAACLGKGTGSGLAPYLCELGRKLGVLTVAIVAKGSTNQGQYMEDNYNYAIEKIEKYANAIFVVENDIVKAEFPKEFPYESIKRANDSLYTTMRVVNSLIQTQAFVKADFSDVERCLTDIGYFMAGIGESSDIDDAGVKAVEEALSSCFYKGYELRPTGLSVMQTTYGNKYNWHHIDQAYDTLRGKARGDKSFGIIPADNPIEDIKNFRVELIAPLQRKPINTWDEEDAVIDIKDKNPNNGNTKSPKSSKPATNFDNPNLLDLHNDNDTNKRKDYMPTGGISIYSKSPETLEPITPIQITKLSDINGRPHGIKELSKLDKSAYERYGGVTYNTPIDEEVPTDEDELLRLTKMLRETTDPERTKDIIMQIQQSKHKI